MYLYNNSIWENRQTHVYREKNSYHYHSDNKNRIWYQKKIIEIQLVLLPSVFTIFEMCSHLYYTINIVTFSWSSGSICRSCSISSGVVMVVMVVVVVILLMVVVVVTMVRVICWVVMVIILDTSIPRVMCSLGTGPYNEPPASPASHNRRLKGASCSLSVMTFRKGRGDPSSWAAETLKDTTFALIFFKDVLKTTG